MNARPALPSRSPIVSLVAASVAALIAAGVFASVAVLFECDCRPMEKFFVAQRE